MKRLSPLDPDALTKAQKEVHDKIIAGPRGGVRGPFVPMLLSPGVCDYVQGLGAYLRFDAVLPGKLRELAILTTARFWKAEYEWNAHVPFATKEGLDPAITDAIAEERTPDFSDADEKAVYTFISELHGNHRVSDAAFSAIRNTFGEEATLELTALAGYYTIISMVLNTFQVEPPEGATRLP
ncbi:MAG: carboxymuconolactone decarboxylase family protein [Proteobacteria bacterium]|nr:carboxymuconolactone decarboxylase family protein [Pseudomonadota bacterium]MDA1021936.1 carboxymuconolactone decarboxylase family protein [Pseudomonadota bacterium]